MRRLATLALVVISISASSGWAQSDGKDRVIELAGGERVVMRADGSMVHYDPSGRSIAMPDGAVMTAKDGTRIMMKSKSLWREILDIAASSYARATTGALGDAPPGQHVIELRDGGRIVMGKDGAMAHYDAAGNRQGMADGETMIAKNGSRVLMKNGSLWGSEENHPGPKPAR